ncbi:alanine racemase [Thermophilibacter immobilis]|uniref:Alanine racemase n=1 Tax=Thermophilibacter immobilis TaxID=2779519 RepID=A0A7S7M8X2_9ACTN|nr:alanine racemase [Thermophilibacter immobilis]QOY60909.1 alanine racemase [Thermophilibacter immobilis]
MDKVVSPQDRWSWVEVNLAALRRNTAAFRHQIARGVQMMCVVKADAYGHGAAACAKTMRAAGADQFAVATVAEGVALRRAGISWPILVLSEPPVDCVGTLVEYDLMPAVYTADFALALGEAAAAANRVARYHLAVDTGMTRIGVRRSDALELRRTIDFHRGLECAGTFTHFATADVLDDWDFALQLNRFQEVVSALRGAGLECGLVHCDNTPGTILHPECHFDMCRVGIGLYGLHPAETTMPRIQLEPVMSVRGRVTRALYPSVGDGVGYGMTYRVPKQNIQIATVPIGYADGLARELSNNMDVIVGGGRCRQVGSICMDQFMFAVDVNSARAYRPSRPVEYGDVVTLIGADGDELIGADEMAGLRNTINYEVVCDFGMRLEKIYT